MIQYNILGMKVNSVSYSDVTAKVIEWATKRESRYVCVANVHMTMEAHDDLLFREVVNQADLVTPDGMPLVWMMRWMGGKDQERVYGPELMLRLSKAAAEAGLPIGLYGGTLEANERLAINLTKLYPDLRIIYKYAPPFRMLTKEEDQNIVEKINSSGARILFVGLGCPKQERWMADHKSRILAVMLGVGAAFDIYAGLKPQAPTWMQKIGMEWLFRLMTEPKRLWKRYLYHNPRFIILSMREIWKNHLRRLG